MTVRNRAAETF